MQNLRGAGMRRLVINGAIVAIAVADVTAAWGQTGSTRPVMVRGRPDSVRTDSAGAIVATTRPVRMAMRETDRIKLDSLIQVRERLPIGSPEIRSVEEEIARIMLTTMPRGSAFIRSDGTFTVFVEGFERSAMQDRVMVASKAFRPDVTPRGYIGMTLDGAKIRWQDSTGDYVQYAEYPTVVLIEPNSPASKVGIRFGDSLVAYNGVDVRRSSINMTRLLEPGRTVDMLLRRDGDAKELSVVVDRAPSGYMTDPRTTLVRSVMPSRVPVFPDSNFERRLTEIHLRAGAATAAAGGRGAGGPPTRTVTTKGMLIPSGILGAQLTDVEQGAGMKAISRQKTDHGVLVTRVPAGSPAARLGLLAGDIITTVGDTEIGSDQQLRQVVLAIGPDKRVRYVVMRDGKSRTLIYEPK